MVLPRGRVRGIGIGIDVEHAPDADGRAALLELVVDANEAALLRAACLAHPALSFDIALAAVFSGKEAFYKAAYASVGRFFDFGAVRLVDIDLPQGRLSLRVTQALGDGFAPGRVCGVDFQRVAPATVLTSFAW